MDLIDRTCTFASEPFVKYLTQLLDIQNDEPLLDDGLAGSSGIDYFSVYQLYQHTGTLRGDYQNLVNDPNPVNDGTREMVKIFYDAKPALAVLDWARPHTVLTQWQPLDYLAGPYPLTNSKGGDRGGNIGELPAALLHAEQGPGLGVYQILHGRAGGPPGLRERAAPLLHPPFSPSTGTTWAPWPRMCPTGRDWAPPAPPLTRGFSVWTPSSTSTRWRSCSPGHGAGGIL